MPEHAWTFTPPHHKYIRGVVRLDRPAGGIAPHRLPKRALRHPADPQTDRAEWQPFGVRIAFRGATRGFLDTVREGHPETPLPVVSPIHRDSHETTPGAGAFDVDALAQGHVRFRATGNPHEATARTLTTIRTERERIDAEHQHSDPNLFYLDELTLCGPADAQRPLLTETLPTAAQTHRMTVRQDHHTWPPFDLGDGLVTKEFTVSREGRITLVMAPSPPDCLPRVRAGPVRPPVIGLRRVVRSPVRGHLRSSSSRCEGSEADR